MVAGMVTGRGTLADIGTDHAFLPIELIRQEKICHAIAMDINQGPLKAAKEHIAACGYENQIETRLSDGMAALAPGEACSAVIAGMGGALTVHILTEGKEKAGQMKELILQPQSELWKFACSLWNPDMSLTMSRCCRRMANSIQPCACFPQEQHERLFFQRQNFSMGPVS